MIFAFIKLIRPYYSLPLTAGFVTIVAYAAGNNIEPIMRPLTMAAVSLFMIISAAYTLNDLCDINIDRINAPKRPLPAGHLSLRNARIITFILFAAGLGIALFANARFFLTISMVTAAVIVYDVFSKRLRLFKAPFVALIATSLYPLAFAIAPITEHPHAKALYIFPVWLLVVATAYEIFKDIRDIKGDSQISSHCYPIAAARILTVLAAMIAPLPSVLGYCGPVYLIMSIIAGLLMITAATTTPVRAIRCIYANVFLITAASYIDLAITIH